MNLNFFLPPHRGLAAATLLGLGGMMIAGGCSHRPIIVQAAPATVIQQSPAPAAPATSYAPPVVLMKEAPPAPRFEQTTPQPSSDSVWIPGYWFYRDGQQQWMSGHWDVPPRVGATWIAPRWEKQGDGYVFIQGYWQ